MRALCTNDEDLFSQEPWTDTKTVISLESGGLWQCYDVEKLREWTETATSQLAECAFDVKGFAIEDTCFDVYKLPGWEKYIPAVMVQDMVNKFPAIRMWHLRPFDAWMVGDTTATEKLETVHFAYPVERLPEKALDVVAGERGQVGRGRKRKGSFADQEEDEKQALQLPDEDSGSEEAKGEEADDEGGEPGDEEDQAVFSPERPEYGSS